MKKANVKDLEDGMMTADEIRTKGGQLIIGRGVTLNRQLIMRLTFYNIQSIFIEDSANAASADVPPAKPQLAPAYAQKVKASHEFHSFQIDHSIVLHFIKVSFEEYINDGKAPQADQLLLQVTALFDSCKTSLELFNMLHNMRSSDDSIHVHSLNVALICRRIGTWLKIDEAHLNTLTLCGLFHDIGKLKIPADILNKPGKYSDEEFELVKQHPRFGYDLLKSLPLDEQIKKSALSHHERCDGSGYPMGITQNDTDDFAMIVAIADVYDAMTAARSYRAPLCPFQVIACFENEGLQKYKPQYILTFLEHIAGTYQNNRILLNDGRSGNIVMLNQSHLSKPIIQFNDGSCIDLSTHNDLHIQAII